MPHSEDLYKSIEELVDKALENSEENKDMEKGNFATDHGKDGYMSEASDKTSKSSQHYSQPDGGEADHPLHTEEVNGGHDKYKSGSPFNETKELSVDENAVYKAMEEAGIDAESIEKAMKMYKMKKMDMKEKMKDDKDMEKADMDMDEKKKMMEKKDMKKMSMKKSIEELSEHLPQDELDVIQAWREANAEEEVNKSMGVSAEEIEVLTKSAIQSENENLHKSLHDVTNLVKSLSAKVEELSSQPAYEKRSVSTLEPLEKSLGHEEEQETISKSQVTNLMLDLQKAGKGITSHHITEMEATGNISDQNVSRLVKSEIAKLK